MSFAVEARDKKTDELIDIKQWRGEGLVCNLNFICEPVVREFKKKYPDAEIWVSGIKD